MMMIDTEGFDALLADYPPPIAVLARALGDIVLEGYPALVTKVLSGWQALSFTHKKAGYVCGVFLQADQVRLLFEHGNLLSDPEGVLCGETKQTRHIVFVPGDEIPGDIITHYISEAIALRA